MEIGITEPSLNARETVAIYESELISLSYSYLTLCSTPPKYILNYLLLQYELRLHNPRITKASYVYYAMHYAC